jgi:hypothetical protein
MSFSELSGIVHINDRMNEILELIETNQIEELTQFVEQNKHRNVIQKAIEKVVGFLNSYYESYYLFEKCSVEMMELLYKWNWFRFNAYSSRTYELCICRAIRNTNADLNSTSAFPLFWWIVVTCKHLDKYVLYNLGILKTIASRCTTYDIDMCLKYDIYDYQQLFREVCLAHRLDMMDYMYRMVYVKFLKERNYATQSDTETQTKNEVNSPMKLEQTKEFSQWKHYSKFMYILTYRYTMSQLFIHYRKTYEVEYEGQQDPKIPFKYMNAVHLACMLRVLMSYGATSLNHSVYEHEMDCFRMKVKDTLQKYVTYEYVVLPYVNKIKRAWLNYYYRPHSKGFQYANERFEQKQSELNTKYV